METTRNYTVQFVKACIFADGKITTETVAIKQIKGTHYDVYSEARGMVRPMFGGTHYDGDWLKVITLDERAKIPNGFELTYTIHYLDDIRKYRPYKEEIWVTGIF